MPIRVKLLSSRQAAEVVGVSPGRFRQLIVEGRVKGEKVGRGWIFEAAEIERFAATYDHRAGRRSTRPRKGKAH